jgi:hypothetical protein
MFTGIPFIHQNHYDRLLGRGCLNDNLDEDWISEGLPLRVVSLPGALISAWFGWGCEQDADGGLRATASRVERLFDRCTQFRSRHKFQTIAIVPIAGTAVLDQPALI